MSAQWTLKEYFNGPTAGVCLLFTVDKCKCNSHIRLPFQKEKQPGLYLMTLLWCRSVQTLDVTSRRHFIEIPAELPCTPPPFSSSFRCPFTSSFHLQVVTARRTFHSDFPRNSFPFNLNSPASPDLLRCSSNEFDRLPEAHQGSNQQRTQLWRWTQPRCCCCCWFWAQRRSSKVSRATDGPLSGKTHRRLLGLRVQCSDAFFDYCFVVTATSTVFNLQRELSFERKCFFRSVTLMLMVTIILRCASDTSIQVKCYNLPVISLNIRALVNKNIDNQTSASYLTYKIQTELSCFGSTCASNKI